MNILGPRNEEINAKKIIAKVRLMKMKNSDK